MSIRRAPRPDSGWFLVRNDVARDARLSPKARGVLIFMLSFPDDWRLDHRTIARANNVGRDYVLGALKELRSSGYLVQERRRSDKGQWITVTVLFDTPRPSTDFPDPENPDPASPDPAEPDPYEGLSPKDCDESKKRSHAGPAGAPTSSSLPTKPRKPRPKPLKGRQADSILTEYAEQHGGVERVTACLRGCHGAQNPGSWLLDLEVRGQLDGFVGNRGLGDTCWNCGDATDNIQENAS